MMLPLLMASVLVSTPEQAILDDAHQLGHDLAIGEVCEALQAASIDFDKLVETFNTLVVRAEAANISEDALEKAAEDAATALGAEFETRYPAGQEAKARTELTAVCTDLITSRAPLFVAYQAD